MDRSIKSVSLSPFHAFDLAVYFPRLMGSLAFISILFERARNYRFYQRGRTCATFWYGLQLERSIQGKCLWIFIQVSDPFLLIIMSVSGVLCLLRLYLFYFLSVGLGEFAPGVWVYIPAGARWTALSERNRWTWKPQRFRADRSDFLKRVEI